MPCHAGELQEDEPPTCPVYPSINSEAAGDETKYYLVVYIVLSFLEGQNKWVIFFTSHACRGHSSGIRGFHPFGVWIIIN